MYIVIDRSTKNLVAVLLLTMHLLVSCNLQEVQLNPHETAETACQPIVAALTQTADVPLERALAETEEKVLVEEVTQQTQKITITTPGGSQPDLYRDSELIADPITLFSHGQEFKKKDIHTLTSGKEKNNLKAYQKWVEKNTVGKKEVVGEGQDKALTCNQLGLPLDILQNIVDHLDDRARGFMRQLNRSFYRLLTGYPQPGVVGLEDKPQGSFFKATWVQKNKIDFNHSVKPIHKIPSFVFYRLLGRVAWLPQPLWPYMKNSYIQELDFSLSKKVQARGGSWIQANLKASGYKESGQAVIGDTEVMSLATYLPATLQSLSFYNNQVGNRGIAFLADHWPTSLKVLDLGYNRIGDNGIASLAMRLSSLQTLYLVDNLISHQGVSYFAPHLSSNLQKLRLGYNPQIGDMGIAILAPFLPTRLQELGISASGIGDRGVAALAPHLPASLKELYLKDNPLRKVGLLALVDRLPAGLQKLDISNTQLGNAGVTVLVNHLPASLIELYVANNQISDSGLATLVSSLPTSIKKVCLKGNRISHRIQSQVIKQYPKILWEF